MGQFRNEAKAGFVKKFKGKKKIKTLIEKKQKGLHLSQVERKKIVKLEAKKQLKVSYSFINCYLSNHISVIR